MNNSLKSATLGAGCFWCVEGVFQRLKGVERAVPGYAGGKSQTTNYEEVCTGLTGHAEVVRIEYNPEIISFEELLEVFWKTHDPTTMNRQGNDVGTQYRSAIFYHDDTQKEIAEKYKKQLNESQFSGKNIVTEIVPLENYSEAEAYHQNYFNKHPDQGYCQLVIKPKIEKFNKDFSNKVR